MTSVARLRPLFARHPGNRHPIGEHPAALSGCASPSCPEVCCTLCPSSFPHTLSPASSSSSSRSARRFSPEGRCRLTRSCRMQPEHLGDEARRPPSLPRTLRPSFGFLCSAESLRLVATLALCAWPSPGEESVLFAEGMNASRATALDGVHSLPEPRPSLLPYRAGALAWGWGRLWQLPQWGTVRFDEWQARDRKEW